MANINNINTENTWLDVETVAKLKNISKRGIRLSLNQDKYEYKVEKVRGGKTYKIKLSSLEEEYQIKYIKEYYNDLTYVDGEIIELQNLNIKQEKLISEVQKQRALAKYDIVMCWLEFRRSYKKNKIENANSDKKFVELYNTGILHENIFKTLGKISFGSLYR